MLKTRVRVTSCFLWVALTMLGFYSPNPVKAENYTATATERDFYFTSSEPTIITIRTYAWQYGIDSMLWLYDDQGTVVAANDDYFGLDSYISIEMIPNVQYRLRAGVCCGDPERWYGTSYVIEPSLEPTNAPTTTTETTTTTTQPPTTTTTSTTSTTTTTEAPLPLPTTTVVSTTTLPPLVATTSSSSTSTVPATTTVASSTTVLQTTTTTILPSTSTTLPVTTSSTTIPPIDDSLSPEEAVAIVTSAEVLKELTPDEATQVFDSLEVTELSDEQADALVEAVQDAPEEVRAAFEEEVNIFDNKFNSYVPLGSNINVGQRKVLVAASGVLFMAPTVSVSSSSTSGTQSDSRKRR